MASAFGALLVVDNALFYFARLDEGVFIEMMAVDSKKITSSAIASNGCKIFGMFQVSFATSCYARLLSSAQKYKQY